MRRMNVLGLALLSLGVLVTQATVGWTQAKPPITVALP